MSPKLIGGAIGAGAIWWVWAHGYFVWVVVVIVIYVIWMWVRIPLERGQRRSRMPSFTEIKPWKD